MAWLIECDRHDGHDGHDVGYVVVCFEYSLAFGGRCAYLDEVFVDEAYRGQGIGLQASAFATDACCQRGIHTLHLEVEQHNRRAIRVYECPGFVSNERMLMSRRLV